MPGPCRSLAPRGPPNHVFYKVSAPGASQGANERPVLQPNLCFTPPRKCPAPLQTDLQNPSRSCLFMRFQLLGPHTYKSPVSKTQLRRTNRQTLRSKLNAQIFQKVRCKLCSLSSKRSLPRRSGRSPLGFFLSNYYRICYLSPPANY